MKMTQFAPIVRILAERGLALPEPSMPAADYDSVVQLENTLYISGQVSAANGVQVNGIVGEDVALEEAQQAAQLCALNIISHIRHHCESHDLQFVRMIKITGFVQAARSFGKVPMVVNGCSSLLAEVLGEAGRHARSSVGVCTLPRNHAVEVDAIVQVSRGAR